MSLGTRRLHSVEPRKASASDADTLQARQGLSSVHLQIRVGIDQKLKIGFYFCEFKVLERRIGSQHWNIFAWLCFERHCRINACLTARHTHDFKDRFAVEFVA